MNEFLNIVTCNNIFKDMKIQDKDGKTGVVRNCEDLHNVHITFDGKGLLVEIDNITVECGGSGLYCFVDNCKDNSENIDPLYYM
jgi:hypothetical protein